MSQGTSIESNSVVTHHVEDVVFPLTHGASHPGSAGRHLILNIRFASGEPKGQPKEQCNQGLDGLLDRQYVCFL